MPRKTKKQIAEELDEKMEKTYKELQEAEERLALMDKISTPAPAYKIDKKERGRKNEK